MYDHLETQSSIMDGIQIVICFES